jgi:putative peptide zinc metalloprotease protein
MAVNPPSDFSPEQHIPAIRGDLQLVRGPRSWRGEPVWQLYDPLRHKFFQVSEHDVAIMHAWRPGPASETLERAKTELSDCRLSDIEALLRFLLQEELLNAETHSLRERLEKADKSRHKTALQTILHKYLFFRIPLVRPDHALDHLYRYLRFFIQPWFIIISAFIGIVALAAIARQWSQFINSFSFFFTLQGVVVFSLTLAGVKILHELGHALMCKHYGLKVPTMGIAFMVMWPVLYTDATDSWRLPFRRQRAAISAAGVGVELVLACYAMALWVLLPDGIARSAAFVVATTAWITSVLVNLNPLMRFDGYYFLSDVLNVPNMQDRSLALARWRWRAWLFGVNEPCPDDLPAELEKWLIVYAWALLIYRFLLFLGIAILVYHFFFKALGIFLFLLEIWWFIARPVMREIKEWPGYLGKSSRRRIGAGAALLSALILTVAFPWRTHIDIPAVISYAEHQHIYAGLNGVIEEVIVENGDYLDAGNPILRLRSPDLDQQLVRARQEVEYLALILSQADTGGKRISERQVLMQRLLHAEAELAGLQSEHQRLVIRTPIAGVVRDMDRSLYSGRWVDAEDRLLTVVTPGTLMVTGWLQETDLISVSSGMSGYFYASGHPDWQGISVVIDTISQTAISRLDTPYQSSLYGGSVPTYPTEDGQHPVQAHFMVFAAVNMPAGADLNHRLRGTLRVRGERRSPLVQAVKHVIAVLIKESGF